MNTLESHGIILKGVAKIFGLEEAQTTNHTGEEQTKSFHYLTLNFLLGRGGKI